MSTTTTVPGRTKHAKAILGDELHKKLGETKVLVVGAGGIGCELIKTLVLSGFINITLLDLDTIDLSNLNRQFLFRTTHLKKPKSLIAASVASTFNPLVHITPIQDNITDSDKYHLEWFRGFDLVLNALDNLEARKYVGRMCVAGGVGMVESGTAGYLGQVQPIVGGVTECFECVEKVKGGKTYPVCTIRSTPSLPIHCVVWSKSYLMGQLFGVDEDAGTELDEAEKQGENAEEIANLRKEAESFAQVRAAIRSSTKTPDADAVPAARMIFDKIFNTDIKRLLSMSDMWNHRAKPVPLDFDRIMQETEVGEKESVALKDQKKLTTKENLELFISSVSALSARLSPSSSTKETVIEFDKDDPDTLDFVTATSNLRSLAYGIPQKSKWEVKEMAGNIIPAIATTNAIIAGLIVLQGVHLVAAKLGSASAGSSHFPSTSPSFTSTTTNSSSYTALRNIHIQLKPSVPLSAITTSRPNPACGICRDVYTVVRCDPLRATLRDVVQGVLGGTPTTSTSTSTSTSTPNYSFPTPTISHFTIFASSPSAPSATRILADPDWDDNLDRTLGSLNVRCGMFVNRENEKWQWEWKTLSIGIGGLPPNYHPVDENGEEEKWLMLPDPLPRLVSRTRRKTSQSTNGSPSKHSLAHAHPLARGPSKNPNKNPSKSPSKKKKLEEDGLVLMESAEEVLDDDLLDGGDGGNGESGNGESGNGGNGESRGNGEGGEGGDWGDGDVIVID
ncbi:uncharacterized protein C8R40DRAFT_1044539 [Lentinula edodes]|uniref:uncharacterized protein n=1 Tax=Lentinula edodes TaxID=5353 RepID=UPI001E8CE191|nr:uncharacterized protein C8R40DRAFT_1044539 [Lentinula edodes]KAH7875766.1 hypothetical protein C8R40DRAFT_1044539 [Lentinula edodes]